MTQEFMKGDGSAQYLQSEVAHLSMHHLLLRGLSMAKFTLHILLKGWEQTYIPVPIAFFPPSAQGYSGQNIFMTEAK